MNHKHKPILFTVALFLVGCLVACSGGKDGAPPQGAPLGAGDLSVTLNRAALSGYTLEASFTVVNRGNEDLLLDPKTGFGAKAAAAEREIPLELDLAACQGSLLQGTVPAGGELTGDLCWKADPTGALPETATITYGTAASISLWEVEAE